MTFESLTAFVSTIITLALGAGGFKMLDRLLKYKEISNKTGNELLKLTKKEKKDGWEIAIDTLRDELEQERARRKEDGIRFYKLETEFRVDMTKLYTRIAGNEKEILTLKSIIISQGLGHLIAQDKVRQEKLDQIDNAVVKKNKRTKKEKMPK